MKLNMADLVTCNFTIDQLKNIVNAYYKYADTTKHIYCMKTDFESYFGDISWLELARTIEQADDFTVEDPYFSFDDIKGLVSFNDTDIKELNIWGTLIDDMAKYPWKYTEVEKVVNWQDIITLADDFTTEDWQMFFDINGHTSVTIQGDWAIPNEFSLKKLAERPEYREKIKSFLVNTGNNELLEDFKEYIFYQGK